MADAPVAPDLETAVLDTLLAGVLGKGAHVDSDRILDGLDWQLAGRGPRLAVHDPPEREPHHLLERLRDRAPRRPEARRRPRTRPTAGRAPWRPARRRSGTRSCAPTRRASRRCVAPRGRGGFTDLVVTRTRLDVLRAMLQHVSYHVGQIALLAAHARRVAAARAAATPGERAAGARSATRRSRCGSRGRASLAARARGLASRCAPRCAARRRRSASAARFSLGARVQGLTDAARARAVDDERTLVKTWTVRGTLHVVPAARPAALRGRVRDERRKYALAWLKRTGFARGRSSALCEDIVEALADGPHTRKEIAARVGDAHGARRAEVARAQLGWRVPPRGAGGTASCFGPVAGQPHHVRARRPWLGQPLARRATGRRGGGDRAALPARLRPGDRARLRVLGRPLRARRAAHVGAHRRRAARGDGGRQARVGARERAAATRGVTRRAAGRQAPARAPPPALRRVPPRAQGQGAPARADALQARVQERGLDLPGRARGRPHRGHVEPRARRRRGTSRGWPRFARSPRPSATALPKRRSASPGSWARTCACATGPRSAPARSRVDGAMSARAKGHGPATRARHGLEPELTCEAGAICRKLTPTRWHHLSRRSHAPMDVGLSFLAAAGVVAALALPAAPTVTTMSGDPPADLASLIAAERHFARAPSRRAFATRSSRRSTTTRSCSGRAGERQGVLPRPPVEPGPGAHVGPELCRDLQFRRPRLDDGPVGVPRREGQGALGVGALRDGVAVRARSQVARAASTSATRTARPRPRSSPSRAWAATRRSRTS